MIVSGTGALDTLNEVPNDLHALGKVYPDKPSLKEEFVNGVDGQMVLKSRKEFTVALVPAGTGSTAATGQQISLGKVNLSWFDPKSGPAGKYETREVDLGQIKVLPAASAVNNPAGTGSQVSGPTADGNKGAQDSELREAREKRKIPSGLITLILAAVLAGMAAKFWRHKNAGATENPSAISMESREAAGDLDSILEDPERQKYVLEGGGSCDDVDRATWMIRAEQHLDAGFVGEALVSIEKALRSIVGLHTGRHVDAMTVRELQGLVQGDEKMKMVIHMMQETEALMFSGRDVPLETVKSLFERLKNHV